MSTEEVTYIRVLSYILGIITSLPLGRSGCVFGIVTPLNLN